MSIASRIVFLIAASYWLGTSLGLAPAASAAPPGALNAKDFGAKGDGATDDAPALNRAIADAAKRGPGTVLFLPAGTYCIGQRTITSPENKRGGFHLGIAHADGLTVEGEAGTLLLCRDLTRTLFSVEHSRNVTIRGLAVDADPLPFTQGTVIACDPAGGTIELQIDPGYDDLDRPDLQAVSEFRIFDSPYCDGFKPPPQQDQQHEGPLFPRENRP